MDIPRLEPVDGPRRFDVFCGDSVGSCVVDVDASGHVSTVEVRSADADRQHDHLITPGLVDLQVNGFAGVDFNSSGLTPERLDRALAAMLACGVTKCLPTLISADGREMIDLLSALDAAVEKSQLGSLMVPGFHIEGPFLSPLDGYAGAHPKSAMRAASMDLIEEFQSVSSRPIMILTVAPEVEGVVDLIGELSERGVACALGHTAASAKQIDDATAAGAIMSTHLGNGIVHLLEKNENPLFAQLGQDRLYASFIADGIHVPRYMLQSWLRAKTLDRAVLVTDATAAAGHGMEPGLYQIGASTIERDKDGAVRIPGSTYLAGSSACMDDVVRNVMAWFGYSLSDALQMARHNPEIILQRDKSGAKPGEPAGFVEWRVSNDLPYVETVHLGPWTLKAIELAEIREY